VKRALKFDIDPGWLTAAFVMLLSGLILRRFVVLFAGDKIVRTVVVGKAARLGFVLVLMGSLGGFELLGLLGLFVGPVVLALAAALWHEWTEYRQLRRADTRSTLAEAPIKSSAVDPIA